MIRIELTPDSYVSQVEVVAALDAINEALENFSLEERIPRSSLYGFYSEDPDMGYVIHGSSNDNYKDLDGIDKLVIYFPYDLIVEIEESTTKGKYDKLIREIASEMGMMVVEIYELPFVPEVNLIITIETHKYLESKKERQSEIGRSARRRRKQMLKGRKSFR